MMYEERKEGNWAGKAKPKPHPQAGQIGRQIINLITNNPTLIEKNIKDEIVKWLTKFLDRLQRDPKLAPLQKPYTQVERYAIQALRVASERAKHIDANNKKKFK